MVEWRKGEHKCPRISYPATCRCLISDAADISSRRSSRMSSKTKKRVVLPSRPDPPTVEQILDDINRTVPNDPVFSVLEDTNQDASRGSTDNEVETKYLQSRRYLELNEQLQEVRVTLVRQREELRTAGEQLECSVAEVKGRALITDLSHGTALLETQE